MYELMSLQNTLLPKRFTTHITGEWLFSTMYELVSLHITLPPERLITRATSKWTLPIVYKLTARLCILNRHIFEWCKEVIIAIGSGFC
jgi:hypothetical protein